MDLLIVAAVVLLLLQLTTGGYVIARTVSDARAGRRSWAIVGAIAALGVPVFFAFAAFAIFGVGFVT